MRIFVNQTAVRLIIQTGINFNQHNIISQQIIFQDPGGAVTEWDANKLSGEEDKGSIFIDFSNTVKFVEVGMHKIRASLVFDDDRIGIGRWISYYVSA